MRGFHGTDPALELVSGRLAVGKIVPDDYTRNSRRDSKGLLEVLVGSVEAVQTLLASPQFRGVVGAFADAIRADRRVIATKENLFWDQNAGIDESARLIRDYPPVYHPPADLA